jgi:hypothetical protein
VRRLVLLLFVLFLVNLPVVSQHLAERTLDRKGRDVVATVVDSTRRDGHDYLDYRLPEDVDPQRTRYSVEVDDASFEQARTTHQLAVRVVPGQPRTNRPVGAGSGHTFLVVALLGDAVMLVIAWLWWRRRQRWHRFEVLEVQPGQVRLRGTAGDLVAAAPEPWTDRVQVGRRVAGGYHLAAEEDLLPGPPLSGLEQQAGPMYVVSGRVVDTRAGWALLELADGLRIRVETGPHRIRADIRESTEVRGVLCFTPRYA